MNEMDSFYYHDIFSTKGIEYLLIISFFLVFIPFYRYLKEVEYPLFSLAAIRLPRGIFFDRTHTWAYLKSEGHIEIGIDDFLQKITGQVKIELLKHSGDSISRGEAFAEVSSGERTLKLYSPISGTLEGINKSALRRFSKRTHSDYTENWLLSIQPKRWELEKPLLILGDKARQWMQNERGRLRDVLVFALQKYDSQLQPVLLQEGGELADGALEELPKEIWEEFQSEFIDAAKT